MNIAIDSGPSYGLAVVTLDKGETIIAESGAMAAMSTDLVVKPQLSGRGKGDLVSTLQSLIFALARRFLAGESVFVNAFTAKADGQQVMLAPGLVGDVRHVQLAGNSVTVQAGSYLGSTPGVIVGLVWGGFSMLFGGEGAFFLKCRGTGDLLINCYGAIEEVPIDGKYIVDTGHVVAFTGDLKYTIRRPGGWKSMFFSGEGLVLEFSGQGTLWTQTRNLSALASWISPFFGGK